MFPPKCKVAARKMPKSLPRVLSEGQACALRASALCLSSECRLVGGSGYEKHQTWARPLQDGGLRLALCRRLWRAVDAPCRKLRARRCSSGSLACSLSSGAWCRRSITSATPARRTATPPLTSPDEREEPDPLNERFGSPADGFPQEDYDPDGGTNFCPYCGEKTGRSTAFCPNCGRKLPE